MTPAPNDGRARLGIFGGAFDPPHIGHEAIIRYAIDRLQLDCVIVLPTGDPPHKTVLTPAEVRFELAELAYRYIPEVVVDARETKRRGPSYSIDTLEEFRAENAQAELVLIIGEDQARLFDSWHRAGDILKAATVAVFPRGGESSLSDPRFTYIDAPIPEMSSTDIRERVRRGASLRGLLRFPVARRIQELGLYRGRQHTAA